MDARGGLRLEGLVKRFDDVTAVAGVDLELPPGKLISFLGPSGCGKTTMLRMIAGLERPTEGRVFLDEEDVTDRPAYTRDIGMVFQSLALFPHLNVAGNIGYGLRIRGTEKDQHHARESGSSSTSSRSRVWVTGGSNSCRAASGSASRPLAPWRWSRGSSSWTSRCRRSTPTSGSSCRWSCACSSSSSGSRRSS